VRKRIAAAAAAVALAAAIQAPALARSHALAITQPSCGVIVHRGYHAHGIQAESMQSAVRTHRLGAWFDGDIQLTADGVPVLWHDNRLPDGSLVGSENLAQVRDQGVITLTRLAHYAARHDMPALLEVKRISALTDHDLRVITGAIRAHGDIGLTLLGGGDFGGLRRIHALAPHLFTYWRADDNEPLTTDAASRRSASFVEASSERWTPELVSQFRAAGYLVGTRNSGWAEWEAAHDAGATLLQVNNADAAAAFCRAHGD
jgi:hypothetical protein